MRFILASKSPSRLELLRRAGLDPEVHASDVDESLITDPQPVRLALRRAAAKGEFVAERVAGEAPELLELPEAGAGGVCHGGLLRIESGEIPEFRRCGRR